MSVAVLEAPAVIAGFDDIALMGEAIEQCGCHFGVGKHAGPFCDSQMGGDDDRGTLVKTTDEVKQELTAGFGKGQIAKLVEDDQINARTSVIVTTNRAVQLPFWRR